MTQPYSSPPANLRSLRDRLTQAAQRQGVVFGRLQRHVAMIVVAQFAAMLTDDNGAPLLLVKGGSSLELRRGIPDSRTSKDFDTVARREIEEVHEQLAEAGEAGWEGFTAIFTAPEEIDVPGMPVKPRRFTAKLGYRGKPFASVPIEVSTVEAGNADQCARSCRGSRGGRRAVYDDSLAGRAEAPRGDHGARSAESERPRSRLGGLAASRRAATRNRSLANAQRVHRRIRSAGSAFMATESRGAAALAADLLECVGGTGPPWPCGDS
jgi:Nucleotidyl transferase AbiEii toxin, Type IV TA system